MTQPEYRIGVVVPGHIEIGRAVLRGVRAWCNAHPETDIEVISTSGLPDGKIVPDPLRKCIIVQAASAVELDSLRQICPHVVSTSNRFPLIGYPQVISDDTAVGRMGARYLLNRGFRSLVYLGAAQRRYNGSKNIEFSFSRERRQGFATEARHQGATVIERELLAAESVGCLLKELNVKSEPIGIMAASDLHARWFANGFSEASNIFPSMFALLGVDDDPLEAALSPVGLSSIRLAGERIGYEAANLGMHLANGNALPAMPIRIPPLSVVTRQSTSAFATDDPILNRTLRLMQERMAELGDASEVAKTIGVPRRTLEWHFSKALKSTIARELSRVRLRRTRELLMNTNLTIKEIAYLVGFSEPRMLSVVFKRETGETPSDYRKRIYPC